MPSRRALFAPLAALALAACADASAPSAGGVQSVGLKVDRVVLVSVDGLRADALAHMPQLRALADQGEWTDSMRTVLPSLTVPAHLSMLSGRDVTAWGVGSNTLDSTAAKKVVYAGMSTIFDWVRGIGRTAEAVAGADLIAPDLVSSAQSFFGVDTLIATDVDGAAIERTAASRLADDAPLGLLFVHFPDVDLAGHQYGWIVPGVERAAGGDSLGTEYLSAVQHVDSAIARLHAALAPEIAAGHAALVVTADHGGGHGEGCTAGVPAYREHCTAAAGDMTVPFVVIAAGLPARRLPGTPTVTQVGPTVGALLGAWVPSVAAAAIRLM